MQLIITTLKLSVPINIILLILSCMLFPATVLSAELMPYQDGIGYSFSLPDLHDNTHAQSDYRGKVVLVNFWASWCPPCIQELPELQRLKQAFPEQPFEILAINVGEKKYRVRKFAKLINFELPVLLDTPKKTFQDWGIKTLPTSFLIDADGKIRYRVRGNPGWDKEDTLGLIKKLIAESTD